MTAWGSGAAWLLDQVPELLGERDRPEEFQPVHPVVARLHRHFSGLRICRSGAVVESIVPTIIEQKVDTAAARESYRALVRAYGEPAPGPARLLLPPSPARLARLPYWQFHRFGIERRRADIIRGACLVAQRLEETSSLPLDAAYARLRAVPGIGAWTAACVAGAALGDANAVPVGDFHLRHTVSWVLAGEPRGSDERMLELLEPYGGHRGRVIRLLKLSGLRAPAYGPRRRLQPIAAL